MLMNRRKMMYTFYEEAKEFAQEFIAPYAKKCDEEAIFPVESFQKMGEKGYFNLLIPEQYGGLGKGLEGIHRFVWHLLKRVQQLVCAI